MIAQVSKIIHAVADQAYGNTSSLNMLAPQTSFLTKCSVEMIIFKDAWVASALNYFEKSSKPLSCFAAITTLLKLQYVGGDHKSLEFRMMSVKNLFIHMLSTDRTSFALTTYQNLYKRLWQVLQSSDSKIEEKIEAFKLFARISNEGRRISSSSSGVSQVTHIYFIYFSQDRHRQVRY